MKTHRERLPDVPLGRPMVERQADSAGAGDGRRARGQQALAAFTGTLGEEMVAQLCDIAPDLADWIVDFAYGEVMSRPGLERRSRHIASIAALTTLGTAAAQLRAQIDGALEAGCRAQDVVETIMQTAVFAGFPAAINALGIAREVLMERAPR